VEYAIVNGVSLTSLIKSVVNEYLEDEYDAKIGDLAHEEYLENPETISHEAMMKKYGL
jgi:hypothetical protein